MQSCISSGRMPGGSLPTTCKFWVNASCSPVAIPCATLRARLICLSAYLTEPGAPGTWRLQVLALKHFVVAEQVIAEDAVQKCIGGL